MFLLDTNLVIYAGKGAFPELQDFIQENVPAVSAVSYVEALGFHRITPFEKRILEMFFASAEVLTITDDVLDEAIKLRQMRKMTLGDSLVAGTALAYGLRLATNNVSDFRWIPDLDVLNPISSA